MDQDTVTTGVGDPAGSPGGVPGGVTGGVAGAQLTIGDLADATGLSSATLRMWEQRHGFPVPQRRESGHRRYTQADVEAIGRVLERRASGMRLEAAVAQVQEQAVEQARLDATLASPSIYAFLRDRHAGLTTHRLRKSTLLGLSWSIEDEFCAKAEQADVFGAFQRERFYDKAEPRWAELAQYSRSTTVFADFEQTDLAASPVRVALAPGAPLRREWAIVCDAPDLPVVLTAWEIPGQQGVRDRDRVFESMWSVEPAAVHDAARVCAHVAGSDDLGPTPRRTTMPETAAVTRLFNRVVSYVDRLG